MNTILFEDGYDQELKTQVKHLQIKWMYRTCNTPTLKKIFEVQRIIPNYRHGTMTIAASMPRDTPMSTRRCLFRLSVDCVDPKKSSTLLLFTRINVVLIVRMLIVRWTECLILYEPSKCIVTHCLVILSLILTICRCFRSFFIVTWRNVFITNKLLNYCQWLMIFLKKCRLLYIYIIIIFSNILRTDKRSRILSPKQYAMTGYIL